jgi:hypothetical protein
MKMKRIFLESGKVRKIINCFFFCFLAFFPFLSKSQTLVSGKIPIDSTRWYQLNNTPSNTMSGLTNGVLQENVNLGYGLMLSNWDIWYPVLTGEVIQLEQIKMYDWQGSNPTTPVTIYVIDDKWQKTQIGSFTGANYDVWDGPYPDSPNQYNLKTPITNIKYIVINTYGDMPAEIEFYGKYHAPNAVLVNPTMAPLKNMTGVNGYAWSLLTSDGGNINTKSLNMSKAFAGYRHYLDWQQLEDKEGSYSYNPCTSGSWNLDTMYATCKALNIEMLACIKTIPDWMNATYPTARQNDENAPMKFGKDLTLPASYIEQAKLAFQYTARYGSNKNVSPALLSVNTTPRWPNDQINTIKIGLNLVKYIECDNERDKWWKGRDAYQTGREYAANLSAFYDGNLNTMGVGVGAKNADPNIKIVMAGTALPTIDYFKGMVDWCLQYRGRKADGTINYCWDVINYHFYSNDAGSSQSGNATSGAAPENAGYEASARSFINAAAIFGNNMPVWVTETGYDVLPAGGSTQFAPAIGKKTVLQTQGDWTLRTSLISARAGINRVFYYQIYDDNSFGGQFGTSGLLSYSDSTRRPAAQYLFQLNQNFGNYVYKETINHRPEVDRYEYNGQSVFAVWNPTQTGATTTYTLQTGSIDSAKIYTPNDVAETMKIATQLGSASTLSLTVTETPIFVVPYLHQNKISLIDFGVKSITGHKVGLGWTVSADSTVKQFSIERMDEATQVFSSIGTVAPNAVHTLSPVYAFVDSLAKDGLNHYRLKITLNDLTFFYSNIDVANIVSTAISVIGQPSTSIVCYPNPFVGSISVQGLTSGKQYILRVFSMDGALVKTSNTTGNKYQWNLSNLPNGIYTLLIDDGKKLEKFHIGKMPSY